MATGLDSWVTTACNKQDMLTLESQVHLQLRWLHVNESTLATYSLAHEVG